MKDRFGQELEVGDTVAAMMKNYRELVMARVVSISEQMLTVEYKKQHQIEPETYRTWPMSVVKKPVTFGES